MAAALESLINEGRRLKASTTVQQHDGDQNERIKYSEQYFPRFPRGWHDWILHEKMVIGVVLNLISSWLIINQRGMDAIVEKVVKQPVHIQPALRFKMRA